MIMFKQTNSKLITSSQFTEAHLKRAILFTTFVARSHGDSQLRAASKLAIASIAYLDETDPDWRIRLVSDIRVTSPEVTFDYEQPLFRLCELKCSLMFAGTRVLLRPTKAELTALNRKVFL